jgi:predicted 2-oxoglutarate/Fe(II)-dependent dioxygenase YbiX
MHFDIRKIQHLKGSLDPHAVSELLTLAKAAPKVDAEVAKIVDGEYIKFKKSDQCNASLVQYDAFSDNVESIVSHCRDLVKKYHGLPCISEEIEFVYYSTGTRYWPHVDGQAIDANIATRGNIQRDITCVAYLNDDYDGGELYFQFFGLEMKPAPGDIVMYPSSWQYIHGVEPVIGERYALVIWFKTDPPAYSLEDEVITDPKVLRVLSAQARIK